MAVSSTNSDKYNVAQVRVQDLQRALDKSQKRDAMHDAVATAETTKSAARDLWASSVNDAKMKEFEAKAKANEQQVVLIKEDAHRGGQQGHSDQSAGGGERQAKTSTAQSATAAAEGDVASRSDSAAMRDAAAVMFGEPNKNITNEQINQAIDALAAKYKNKPDMLPSAIFKAAVAAGVSAQQLADVGRPGITREVIDKYLESIGITKPSVSDPTAIFEKAKADLEVAIKEEQVAREHYESVKASNPADMVAITTAHLAWMAAQNNLMSAQVFYSQAWNTLHHHEAEVKYAQNVGDSLSIFDR